MYTQFYLIFAEYSKIFASSMAIMREETAYRNCAHSVEPLEEVGNFSAITGHYQQLDLVVKGAPWNPSN